jgi:hypothetical protein
MHRQRRQRLWGNRSRRPYGLIDGCFRPNPFPSGLSIAPTAAPRAHLPMAGVWVSCAHRIAAYASRQDRPTFPFWPMLFNNTTIRLLGSDDFPSEAKEQGPQISWPRPALARCR